MAVTIEALSAELLDRVFALLVEEHRGPRARSLLRQLATVNTTWHDVANRRLWRRIVIDYGKRLRSRRILDALELQPVHAEIRHLLVRSDGVLGAKQTTETLDVLSQSNRLVELAIECRLSLGPLLEVQLNKACEGLVSLERFRLEPPLLDEDRYTPERAPNKYSVPMPMLIPLPSWNRLRAIELWQVRADVAAAVPKATYRLTTLSLRDVSMPAALCDQLFAPENVAGISRLTLDYFCPVGSDDPARFAFAGSLARLVKAAAPTLRALSLMAPQGLFHESLEAESDQAMRDALCGLTDRLIELTIGGDAISPAIWTSMVERGSNCKKLDIGFVRQISSSSIVASLQLPMRWSSLQLLKIRTYEYPVRTAAFNLPYSSSWSWAKGDLRQLRRIADERSIELRFDERTRLPDDAYTTAEEDESEDEGGLDGNAIFQLDEEALEDLRAETAREVELRNEIRARESSEGDDFVASEADEL